MKKELLIVLVVILPLFSFAQKLFDRSGYVHFFSQAPLENIEADNHQVLAVLDLATGQVAVSVLMKGFHFEKALMQEHFNENYIESDKFPKALFSGTLQNFSRAKYMAITSETVFKIIGELTIHGVTRPLETEVYFQPNGETIQVETKFMADVKAFDIEIPSLLTRNIAEEVLVTGRFTFKKEEQ